MNSTQNKKIAQVKEKTMVTGIDVGSEKHYFRAFNWRGIEVTRKPVSFTNSKEGFDSFNKYIIELMQKNNFKEALVGFEPTGHYWFDLGQYLGGKKIKFVLVNPHHVKKSKELDDNSPSKNDPKDLKIIAGLVREGSTKEVRSVERRGNLLDMRGKMPYRDGYTSRPFKS